MTSQYPNIAVLNFTGENAEEVLRLLGVEKGDGILVLPDGARLIKREQIEILKKQSEGDGA